MALTAYDKQHLSTADQAKITAATNAWNTAKAKGDTAGMTAAAAQAAAVRNAAGYKTDASGNYSGSYTPSGTAVQASQSTAKPAQVGSGGYATTGANNSQGYTGSMEATDPYKNKITVQYQNGKLVSDVPDGTTIHTNGGDFVYYKPQEQEETNPEDQSGMLSTYANLYSSGGTYSQALTQQQAANDAAVQKAVNDLEAQKTDTNQRYSDIFRQLYINKMNGQKNLNQQLAAQGITGGMAETTRLGYDTSYSEALRQGEQERLNAISGLDKAITDTKLTGDIENAQAAADSIKEQTNSYAAVLQNLISRNDTLALNEKTDAANQQAIARQLALQMLQNGDRPSDTLLTAAGIGAGDAQTILNSATKPTYTSQQAAAALASALKGDTRDEVRAMIEGYFGLPMETVLLGQQQETTPSDSLVTMAIYAALASGGTPEIQAIIEGAYPGLTMEQVLDAYEVAYGN